MKLTNGNLKIAIQKKGRLSEYSMSILKNIGLDFDTYHKGQLLAQCNNMPVDILFIRDDDIPEYVQDGICDLGIVGNNIIQEKKAKIKTIESLDFGRCKLALAVPEQSNITDIKQLNNKRIATSYPTITSSFLKKNKIKAKVIKIQGAVEITPALDVADAICDLVSTGSTIKQNRLREIETVMKSEAMLIRTPKISIKKKKIIDRLLMRIKGVLKAKQTKYIMMNAPKTSLEKITKIIPGLKSPTVLSLAEPGMIAIHSVVPENVFWEVIEKLKKAGASGILVSPIEKMIV